MQRNKLEDLLEKYRNGMATDEEKAIVESWYLKHEPVLGEVPLDHLEVDQKSSIELFLKETGYVHKRSIWPSIAAAASLLLFLSVGGYYLYHPAKKQTQYSIQKQLKPDLLPGGNKATITLSNGNIIVLNGAKNGMIARQGGTKISKTSDGQVSYAANRGIVAAPAVIVYNTASTPRGGQFQFILSDGTKVWLNSSSSIRFPVTFTGSERKVELIGEAYFEVEHDSLRPFRVVSKGQTVEDLGTHFNINAYSDELSIKTTLLEGSVRVSAGDLNHIIKPGEQSQLKNGGLNVVNVDVDEAVAWKNGFFHFDDSSIQEVARQLSRWYDVDIKYENQLPDRRFSGKISRNVNASQLLDILSFSKIHYRIEGKSIVILP